MEIEMTDVLLGALIATVMLQGACLLGMFMHTIKALEEIRCTILNLKTNKESQIEASHSKNIVRTNNKKDEVLSRIIFYKQQYGNLPSGRLLRREFNINGTAAKKALEVFTNNANKHGNKLN